MKEQFETVYPAETLFCWTVTKPAKRLLGIAANRYGQAEKTHADSILQTENKIVNLQERK